MSDAASIVDRGRSRHATTPTFSPYSVFKFRCLAGHLFYRVASPRWRRSPWQNPYSESLKDSIRREFLDHETIFNERRLSSILTGYFDYNNRFRVHQSSEMDTPEDRESQTTEEGRVIAIPHIGGLHHHYKRKAACAPKTMAEQYSGCTTALSPSSFSIDIARFQSQRGRWTES
jgi:hypothetical protein